MNDTIKISKDSRQRLDDIAQKTNRSTEDLIREAFESYLLDYDKGNDWKEIDAEIDAGRFASDDEVARAFHKAKQWERSSGSKKQSRT